MGNLRRRESLLRDFRAVRRYLALEVDPCGERDGAGSACRGNFPEGRIIDVRVRVTPDRSVQYIDRIGPDRECLPFTQYELLVQCDIQTQIRRPVESGQVERRVPGRARLRILQDCVACQVRDYLVRETARQCRVAAEVRHWSKHWWF